LNSDFWKEILFSVSVCYNFDSNFVSRNRILFRIFVFETKLSIKFYFWNRFCVWTSGWLFLFL